MKNSLKSKLKTALKRSRALPAIYSFLTRPLASRLRHLKTSILLPEPEQLKKVSVVVPNYNYSKYLKARISSILNQTYKIHELIILDDASTDNSENVINEILKKAKNAHPDISFRFLKNSKNTGKPISQWQKGFKEATGDFIWLAEADDFSDKNFLTAVMSKFEKDESIILSFSNSVAIDSNGHTFLYDFMNHSVDKEKTGHWRNDYISSGEQEIKNYLSRRCSIPNVSAVVFKNDKTIPFEKYLESAKQYTQVGDWYFYLEVLKHGKLAYTRQSLNFFRIHQNSVTANSNQVLRRTYQQEIEQIIKIAKTTK